MNSNKLKYEYKDVYLDFFSKNNIVISMPFLMSWVGDYSITYCGLNIKQKIPLRMYLGISFDNDISSIKLDKITYYDLSTNNFVNSNILEYSNYFSDVQNYLINNFGYILKKYKGIKVNLLTELPRSAGLGFDSIFAMLISSAIERLNNNFFSEDVLKLKLGPLNILWTNYISFLSPIFNTASDIVDFIKLFPATGNQISSFYSSHYPIVSFSEDMTKYLDETFSFVINKNKKGYAFRFNELTENLNNLPYLPIDYGIIYSGYPVITEQVLYSNIHALDWIPKAKKGLRESFKKILELDEVDGIPKFYQEFLKESNKDFERIYSNLMMVISLEIFNLMAKIYTNGYSEENIKMLILALNKFRYSNYVRYFSSGFFGFINNLIKNIHTPIDIGISPNDTTVMGGTINFILPLEMHRKVIKDGILETAKIYQGAQIIYKSWIDGIESDGIKFEQDLENGLYSEFVGHNLFKLTKIGGDSKIIDYDIEQIKKYEGLIIDKIKNKIYVNGKSVGSKILPSQSATIEILSILVSKIGEEISNKDLPLSSYSKNRNGILGKIFIPIIKLVFNETGKQLRLTCKGCLENFYIKFELSELDIYIINKLK